MSDAPPSCVYFITHGNGPVKIGWAVNPEKRLLQLQTGNPKPLRIKALLPGGQPEEAEYHRRFAKHRLVGEWFARAPEIIEEMRRLREEYRHIFGFL